MCLCARVEDELSIKRKIRKAARANRLKNQERKKANALGTFESNLNHILKTLPLVQDEQSETKLPQQLQRCEQQLKKLHEWLYTAQLKRCARYSWPEWMRQYLFDTTLSELLYMPITTAFMSQSRRKWATCMMCIFLNASMTAAKSDDLRGAGKPASDSAANENALAEFDPTPAVDEEGVKVQDVISDLPDVNSLSATEEVTAACDDIRGAGKTLYDYFPAIDAEEYREELKAGGYMDDHRNCDDEPEISDHTQRFGSCCPDNLSVGSGKDARALTAALICKHLENAQYTMYQQQTHTLPPGLPDLEEILKTMYTRGDVQEDGDPHAAIHAWADKVRDDAAYPWGRLELQFASKALQCDICIHKNTVGNYETIGCNLTRRTGKQPDVHLLLTRATVSSVGHYRLINYDAAETLMDLSQSSDDDDLRGAGDERTDDAAFQRQHRGSERDERRGYQAGSNRPERNYAGSNPGVRMVTPERNAPEAVAAATAVKSPGTDPNGSRASGKRSPSPIVPDDPVLDPSLPHHELLGVSAGDAPAEIKKAYRRMVLQHHPDKGGHEEDFKLIKRAFDVLSGAVGENDHWEYEPQSFDVIIEPLTHDEVDGTVYATDGNEDFTATAAEMRAASESSGEDETDEEEQQRIADAADAEIAGQFEERNQQQLDDVTVSFSQTSVAESNDDDMEEDVPDLTAEEIKAAAVETIQRMTRGWLCRRRTRFMIQQVRLKPQLDTFIAADGTEAPDGALVYSGGGSTYHVQVDKTLEFAELMAKGRYCIKESIENCDKLRLCFQFRTNEELEYYRGLFGNNELEYAQHVQDVDMVKKLLDKALKRHVNIVGRRTYDIVCLGGDEDVLAIMTDVVVNYQPEVRDTVHATIEMIVQRVQKDYYAMTCELLPFAKARDKMVLPYTLRRDGSMPYITGGPAAFANIDAEDYIQSSRVIYASRQTPAALFQTHPLSDIWLFPSAIARTDAAQSIGDKVSEIYGSALTAATQQGTGLPLQSGNMEVTVETVFDKDKTEYRIYARNGACLYNLEQGRVLKHGENKRTSYISVYETGRSVHIVCVHDGCCPNHKSANIDKLHCLRVLLTRGEDGDSGGSDDESAEDTKMKRMSKDDITGLGMQILRAFIADKGYKKENGYVVQPREYYQWDYTNVLRNGELMDFAGLVNHLVFDQDNELQQIMYPTDGKRASPWLHSVLVDTLVQSEVLPPLIRDRRYYGYKDGLMQIDNDEGPICKWIRWTDAQPLKIVVRTFLDYELEKKQVLYDHFVRGKSIMIEDIADEHAPMFKQLSVDQGHNEQQFSWPGNVDEDGEPYMHNIMLLDWGAHGRLGYPLKKYDQMAFALSKVGKTGSGKSTATEVVLRAFFEPGRIHQIVAKTEETFGLANLDKSQVLSMPEAEKYNGKYGLSKDDFKKLTRGEKLSIAQKYKDAKPSYEPQQQMVSTGNAPLSECFEPYTGPDDEAAVKGRIMTIKHENVIAPGTNGRLKLEDIIAQEAGAILPIIVYSYQQMVQLAPKNSEFKDWADFIPYFQEQVIEGDPLKAFIEANIDYQPRSQEPDTYTGAKPSYPHTITLRDFMDKYPHTITWQELEARLPDVLTAINGEKMTRISYDKAEMFYACAGCKHYIQKNKNSAAAEVFCCEAFEEKRGDDNFDLKKACVLFDSGKSVGKPRKFMTTDRDGRKKTLAADGVEGPEKVDAACIRNAVWR